MHMFQILICEDDHIIRKLMSTYLKKQGYDIFEAENGQEGFEIFSTKHIDLLITDVMMPLMDGFTLVQKTRQNAPHLPMLIMTALESYQDKEQGFSQGVDDYMVKPVDLKELNLRIKALLRRYQIMMQQEIKLKHVALNYQTKTCYINNQPIELTKKEFLLLFKLVSNPNIIFTREQLMNEIWGYDSNSYDRTVDTHIKRLREQVVTDDFEIITVRGLGYKVALK
jgi:two-component system, OmpR family, response regulator